MQSSDITLLTSIRLLLFLMLLLLIYATAKQSSRLVEKAWRLPIIYPHESKDTAKKTEERQALLKTLSMRWGLYTIIDYSLGVFIAYELVFGFSVTESGIAYYFQVHLPAGVVISFGIGLLLAILVIKFRNPFESGKIQPLKHLVKNLESLVNAVYVGDAISEDKEAILIRIIRKEIERFIDFRKIGDAECGRLLEYLAGLEGAVGRAASTILWP